MAVFGLQHFNVVKNAFNTLLSRIKKCSSAVPIGEPFKESLWFQVEPFWVPCRTLSTWNPKEFYLKPKMVLLWAQPQNPFETLFSKSVGYMFYLICHQWLKYIKNIPFPDTLSSEFNELSVNCPSFSLLSHVIGNDRVRNLGGRMTVTFRELGVKYKKINCQQC